MKSFAFLTLSASLTAAYPFMGMPDTKFFPEGIEKRQNDAQCPTTSDHKGAVPLNPKYPYLGGDPSKNVPGTGKGGIQVPAPGDTDHYFQAPGPNDIRGPCPGLNAAANHGFLSRDGIVTYNELVAAQQNMYNVGYDLANVLAVAGVGLDGDLVTEKLSIGCDSTARTAVTGSPALQKEPGLNGHNKFEADTSLTRNDYFTANGNNFGFNGTLFQMMTTSTNQDYTRLPLSKYRAERWDQSRNDNPNFFFGPGSLLLYGAASFLYELFPGSNYKADLTTMKSFFGAVKNSQGGWDHIPERAPPGWKNRVDPYDLNKVGDEIFSMYGANPKPFGFNTGDGKFNFQDANGTFGFDPLSDSDNVICGLYQLALGAIPATVGGGPLNTVQQIKLAATKLNPIFASYPCPLVLV